MSDLTTASPAQLARQGDLDALDRIWLEEMGSPQGLPRYMEALDALKQGGSRERVGPLAAMLAEALEAAKRSDDADTLLMHLAETCVDEISGIEELCAAHVQRVFGNEPWFDHLAKKAGLEGDQVDWSTFVEFCRCTAFVPGSAVHHRSGWGDGVVADLHPETDEVVIHFATGKRHAVPWQSAIDTMDALPVWDVRAMRLNDPDGLLALAKANPIEVLRRALKIFRGKANASQLKQVLCDVAVPAKSWAAWWRKAKAAAIEDPLIAVEGSATRPTLSLRKKALTLCEEAREALRHENVITAMVKELRAWFEKATRPEDRESLATLARERLGGVAASPSTDVDAVQAIVFLEQLEQVAVDQTVAKLDAFLRDSATNELCLARIGEIPDGAIRSRVVQLMPALGGDGWAQLVATQLYRVSEDCDETLEGLVELLRANKTPELLVDLYERIVPFPAKHPFLLYCLTKAYAEGDLSGGPREPDPMVVCRVIIHVLRVVSDGRGQRATRARLQSRVVTVLLGKRRLLTDLLTSVDRPTMQSIVRVSRNAGDDFPPKVQDLIERVANDKFPELFAQVEAWFWEEGDDIWCTRTGLEARQDEFRHLTEVLIPDNSKAIGDAASQGDLSENADWDAAMEEQRNLTTKATEWEEELKKARQLENQEIPEGIVAPGTKVELRDLDDDTQRSVRILGPWDDVLGNDVVSYRAPLAAALLGRKAQDEVPVTLPSGTIQVRILSVEKVPL